MEAKRLVEKPPTAPDRGEACHLSIGDYSTVMSHLYRGEIHRSTVWRQRLDATTNWAVVSTAAALSFGFGDSGHSHVTFILTSLLVTILLAIESRRYRVFDVWHQRTRLLEENFFVPILTGSGSSARPDWRETLAHDLIRPYYKMSLAKAAARRLRRNYCWVFLVIYAAWLLKLAIHPDPARSVSELLAHATLGPVPGWLVFVLGIGYYLFLLYMVFWEGRGRLECGDIHEPSKGFP